MCDKKLSENDQVPESDGASQSSLNSRERQGFFVLLTCLSLVGFAFVTHQVSMPVRELILLTWTLGSIPAAIGSVVAGGAYSLIGITVILISHWFALAYCSDMGGPYAHFLVAAFVGASALLSTTIILVIGCFRVIRASKQSHEGH